MYSGTDGSSYIWRKNPFDTHLGFDVNDADFPTVQYLLDRIYAGTIEITFVFPVFHKPEGQRSKVNSATG